MIAHAEITLWVQWQMPSGLTRNAAATFVVAYQDRKPIALRLVRVHVGSASLGRRDALLFEQHVEDWEAAALDEARDQIVQVREAAE